MAATPGHAVAIALLASLLAGCRDDRPSMSSTPPPTWIERVVRPRQPTPGGRPPLLVLLHGIGADETDLLPLAPHLDPRLVVVTLRAPYPYQIGHAWFHIDWRADGSVAPDVAQARETLALLLRWLAAAPGRLEADPERVYLLGFSQGAMMSFGTLRTVPERLAGVVALSGRFAEGLFDAPAPTDAVARVPLFLAHGLHDDVLPIRSGRAARDFFAPRVHDLTYREYPIGHGIAPEELRDVAAWLTERLDGRLPSAGAR